MTARITATKQRPSARLLVIILPVILLLLSCGDSTVAKKGISPDATKSTDKAILRQKLFDIIRNRQATVGVSVMSIENGNDTLSINGDHPFALMSVAKLPQTLFLLHLADIGKWDKTQPIAFDSHDLNQYTGSNILKDHPQSSFSLTLPEVLRYMIGQSDNISANKVFALEGGPKAVENYIHSLGIRDIGIATDYAHMDPNAPKQNWGTPKAVTQLLCAFHRRELLSDSSQRLLWTAMVEGTSGADRLKGGLPPGTIIGHKTGTSSPDGETGITPAFNDVGIIQTQDGKHYAISVFVGDTREDNKVNAAIIAGISKAVWEYYSIRH